MSCLSLHANNHIYWAEMQPTTYTTAPHAPPAAAGAGGAALVMSPGCSGPGMAPAPSAARSSACYPGRTSTRSHAPPLRRSLPRELRAARGQMASQGVNRVAPSFPLPFSFSSLARIPSPSSPVSDPDQVWFLVFVALINYRFYMFRHVSIN